MNILIIGATRGLGLSLVNHALDHGHRVTGLARDPMRHGAIHRVRRVPGGSLSLFGGDIVESGPVAEAVEGQDAVCITIGVVPTRDGVDVFSKGTATVIEAMGAGRKAARAMKSWLGLRDTDVVYAPEAAHAERRFGFAPDEHGYARVRVA